MLRAVLNHWYVMHLFDRFKWFRQFYGGHWELWWIDHPVCSAIWHSKPHKEERYGLMRGTPICEDYPRKDWTVYHYGVHV